jgi:hypothetical protein
MILKCVVPLAAAIMFAGTNGTKSTMISPEVRSFVTTTGTKKVVPNFPVILKSKPTSNYISPSITFCNPLSLVISA